MTKKIKILYILPNLSRGGAEKVCHDLLVSLDKEKFSLSLLLFKENNASENWKTEIKSSGVEIVSLKKTCLIDLNNFWQIIKAIKKINPDILHCHLGGDIYGRLAGKILNVPIIVSTEHNINKNESLIARYLKTMSAKYALKIFAVSNSVKVDAEKRYNIKSEKIEIIYNGIETNKFNIRKSEINSENENSKIIIGAIGRLSEQKGFKILIEATKKTENENYLVQIAGTGNQELILKNKIKELKLENRIELIGEVDSAIFLNKLDVFVLPSLWEGLGLVILEAGAANKPTIASKIDGVKEILNDDSSWLFEAGNSNELAKKIDYLINNLDSSEVAKKIINNKKNIETNFNLEKMTSAYERWYELLFEKYAHSTSK